MLTITKKEYDELIKAIEANTQYRKINIAHGQKQIDSIQAVINDHLEEIKNNNDRLEELKAERENAPDA